METRGECKIRALWSEDLGYWFAIEGSHRCAAAAELGIEIEIHDIGNDAESEWVTDLDGFEVLVEPLLRHARHPSFAVRFLGWSDDGRSRRRVGKQLPRTQDVPVAG